MAMSQCYTYNHGKLYEDALLTGQCLISVMMPSQASYFFSFFFQTSRLNTIAMLSQGFTAPTTWQPYAKPHTRQCPEQETLSDFT
jgi:hypothetical protein